MNIRLFRESLNGLKSTLVGLIGMLAVCVPVYFFWGKQSDSFSAWALSVAIIFVGMLAFMTCATLLSELFERSDDEEFSAKLAAGQDQLPALKGLLRLVNRTENEAQTASYSKKVFDVEKRLATHEGCRGNFTLSELEALKELVREMWSIEVSMRVLLGLLREPEQESSILGGWTTAGNF